MNKLMRKLSISILAVVFAVIAMGATTFAWFTLTNTAKVTEFNVKVTSAEGIELSVVDGVWATTIDGSVIEGLDGVSGAKLTAVTTPDGIDTFKTLDTLLHTGAYTLTDAEAGSDYVEFTIKVRTRTASTPIYIDHLSTSIASSGISWQPDTSFTRSDGATITITEETLPFTVHASHSARMSFEGDSTVIYEDTSAGTSGQSSDWTKGALNYFAAKNNYTEMGDITSEISAYTSKPVSGVEDIVIATTGALDGGWSETTIVVRIWLEGWDAECYNAIFSDTLRITIGFKTVDPDPIA